MIAFFTITLIILLAAISPGPDFFLVVKNALHHDRKAGIFTALGVASSLLVHSSYCIVGLGIIITQSVIAFDMVKYLGAAYLIYLGVKCLLAKRTHVDYSSIKHTAVNVSHGQVFLEGFFCNLFNPKAILFMLAFFTLILKPGTPWIAQIGYGLEISLIHAVWFSILAVIITHKQVKMRLDTIQYYIIKVMGVVLIAFGSHIALLKMASL